TNTIEGFWSQLKRSLEGTHHYVSARWLPRYVAEFCWRYNRRHSAEPMVLVLLARAAVPPAAAA
ncbi:MAG: transposase, partial [bacterium]